MEHLSDELKAEEAARAAASPFKSITFANHDKALLDDIITLGCTAEQYTRVNGHEFVKFGGVVYRKAEEGRYLSIHPLDIGRL